jgi:hypothetical protein
MNGIETLELYIIPNTTRVVFYGVGGHSHGSWRDV